MKRNYSFGLLEPAAKYLIALPSQILKRLFKLRLRAAQKYGLLNFPIALFCSCGLQICYANAAALPTCFGDESSRSDFPAVSAAAAEEIRSLPGEYVNGYSRIFSLDRSGTHRGMLFGTMHVAIGRGTFLPPVAYTNFLASDDLTVETSLLSVARPEYLAFIRSLRLSWVTSPPNPFSASLDGLSKGELAEAFRLKHLPLRMINKLSLQSIYNILGESDCVFPLNAKATPTSDILLQQWAAALQKPVHGIESLSESAKMMYGTPNDGHYVPLIKLALRRFPDIARFQNFLTQAYFTGHVSLAVAAERTWKTTAEDKNAMSVEDSVLFDQRNPQFVAAIKGVLSRSGIHFIAVGAEHFIGKGGIVTRLRQDGWTVSECSDTECGLSQKDQEP